MGKKTYKKWAALSLSVAMVTGSFSGTTLVQAETLKEQRMVQNSETKASQAENSKDYIFEGNMARNADFNQDMEDWQVEGGGTATNNGYPESNDKHFYLDPKGVLQQEIAVPFTGTYHASVWIAVAGTDGEFGIKNAETGEVLQSVKVEKNTTYTQYELNVPLEKGENILLYVKGASSWTNGDKFSFTFNCSEFGNMLINSDFTSEEAWTAKGAVVGSGQAVLSETESEISQSFYVPSAGPYIAEAVLENAENAVVTLGEESSEPVSGTKTISVSLENLKIGDEITVLVKGKATVKSFTVKFNLSALNNQAPTASEVKLVQNPEIGTTLKGTYKFEDPEEHKEGATEYKWYASDSENGTYTEIPQETGNTLEITDALWNKYVKFEVTPVDEYLGKGKAVQSNPIGPVYLNIVSNPGFESGIGSWKDLTAEESVEDAYRGTYKGVVEKGKTGYQTITVPETGYYDFSVYGKSGNGNGEQWKFGVRNTAGTVIAEAKENKLTESYSLYELEAVPLEKGNEVQIYFTAPESSTLNMDDVTLKIQPDKAVPPFANVHTFKTTPVAYETEINAIEKKINLKYYYETDISDVTVSEMKLSEGASASVKEGDVLDLTKDCKIVVTDKEGKTNTWFVSAETAEKKVVVHSSNKYLEDTFNWAAQKQRQFVMTGKTGPINVWNNNYEGADEAVYIPSYWAGYYDRTAFYTRDFVHQATGGQIAGLEDENFNMFKAFAKECTEERKWYTVWALNFDGSVYELDYNSVDSFVREVPAQFELVEKAYKQYLWSGDKRYIEDETLWNFYTNVMTKYADSHDANGNGVVQEVGTGIFDGSCTYNERGRQVIEAGDAIGSQYQATLAYAAMLKARGETEASEEWYQKAADLKKYFNEEWSVSDDMESEYVCAWGPNGEKYSDFSKETSWFMPLKMITEAGEKNDAYIDFILENLGEGIGSTSTAPANLEAYTYIPDMLFLYNRNDEAWKWMKYITSIKDEPHERPIQGTNGDYPEISFTFVSHTIEGMMGVEPDAGANFIATAPRLPREVPDVTADHIDVGNSELSLTHNGNTSSALTNVSGDDLTWEARFYGDHSYIKVNDKYEKAQKKEINGEVVSYVTTTVKSGETVNAQATEEIPKSSYVILAEAGEHGSISPSGEVKIGENETQVFTIAADEGYQVKDVSVDGTSVGNVTEYTFKDVTTDHNIKAVFEKVPVENPDTETPDNENPDAKDDKNPSNSSGKPGVKTGDIAQPFLYVLGTGFAAAVIAFIRKRRKI